MPKKPTLAITRISPKEYVLEVSAGISPSGKRQRLKFTARNKAELHKAALLKRAGDYGIDRALMTPKVEREAVAAAKLLKPHGVTILQAAREMAARLEQERKSPTLVALIEEYAQEALKDGASPGHLKMIRWAKGKAETIFGKKLACNLDGDSLIEGIRSIHSLQGLSKKSQRHFHTTISSAYILGVRRKYWNDSPMDKRKKVKLDDSEIGVLTVLQAEAILTSCCPDTLPVFVIGMFAGFRDSEVRRLRWEDFDWKKGTIRLRGSSGTKEKKGRFAKLEPVLARWLAPIKRKEGKVVTCEASSLRKLCKEVRERADTALIGAGSESEATLVSEWDRNTLRHTAVSYWRNAGRTEEEVTRWAGHGVGVHETNYRAALEEGAGEVYFGIVPEKKANVVAMA